MGYNSRMNITVLVIVVLIGLFMYESGKGSSKGKKDDKGKKGFDKKSGKEGGRK